MFGHDSLPSRVYSYGSRAPLERDLVDEQMRLAHRYRNELVRVELDRRAAVDAALVALSPELAEAEARVLAAEATLEAARAALCAEQARARRKVRPPELVAPVTAALSALRAARAERKALRTALFSSPAWKERQAALELEVRARAKAARAACGVYWGSYLMVESSLSKVRSGPPPRFAHADGGGHLAVQLQGGLSVPDLLACTDTRLQVEPVPRAAWEPGGRRLRKTTCRFRVGSTEGGAPVWATLPVVLHRPLPEGASVKWAHLVRRRVGTHHEWRVQFVLSRESGWEPGDRATTGTVGVDVGWRLRPGGALRVAYWAGDDGREGELALDADWLSQMRRVEDIRSVRDVNLNEVRPRLGPLLPASPPQWFTEATATMHAWRAAARFAALAIRWRRERFPGDEAAFALLEEWRKRDRHLLEFEANLRDRLLRSRRDLYRRFAARLRREYRTVVLEGRVRGREETAALVAELMMDLRPFHALPQAEEPARNGALVQHLRDACLSDLRLALAETGAVGTRPAARTTAECWRCGGDFERPDDAPLRLRCSRCGETEDQDRNAAIRLLRAGGGVWPQESGGEGRSQ